MTLKINRFWTWGKRFFIIIFSFQRKPVSNQFIEKTRRKFDNGEENHDVDEEHVQNENFDYDSDFYNTLYSKALRNVGCVEDNHSSTIKRRFALQPDIQPYLKSHIEVIQSMAI